MVWGCLGRLSEGKRKRSDDAKEIEDVVDVGVAMGAWRDDILRFLEDSLDLCDVVEEIFAIDCRSISDTRCLTFADFFSCCDEGF